MSILDKILGHPLTRGLSVDDPRTTLLRRSIIQDKAFLHALYTEWYKRIIGALPQKNEVLELGSGAGFLQQFLPEVITSEVFETPGVRLIADACALHALIAVAIATVLQITSLAVAIIMVGPGAFGIFKRMLFQKNAA
ncbi:MAG: hypothetical protein WCI39_13725 [Gallionellaceae bacterium]